MEIQYENERIKKIFLNYHSMIKLIGVEKTKAVKKRLDQIKASVNFQRWLDTRLGDPHSLTEFGKYSYYGVSVTSNYRLVLRPGTEDNSAESLLTCTIVVVKGVCDYHGDKTNWIVS